MSNVTNEHGLYFDLPGEGAARFTLQHFNGDVTIYCGNTFAFADFASESCDFNIKAKLIAGSDLASDSAVINASEKR